MENKQLEYQRKYIRNNPWAATLEGIRARCRNPNHPYAQKGIKNFLDKEDLKMLWFRDKACEMKKPSIDRIDSKGDYTLENCRYLELNTNRAAGHIKKSHCKHGHEFTPKNVYITAEKKRKCKKCESLRYQRKKLKLQSGAVVV